MSKEIFLKDIWDKLKPGDIFINTCFTRTKIDDKTMFIDHVGVIGEQISTYFEDKYLLIEDYLISDEEELITHHKCSCGYYYNLLGLESPCKK